MTTQESMEIAGVVDGLPQWARARMANHIRNLAEVYFASGVPSKPVVRVKPEKHPALADAQDDRAVAPVIILAARRALRA